MDKYKLLSQYFGFSAFRPGQEAVIDALETHGAALAVFPTGGGKSLCYQLPALAFDGLTVVVSPLIALMKDQIDFLRRRGIDASRLDSSLPTEEAAAVTERIKSGALRILYVAPERFNNERFLAAMRQAKIALFAVDEAHCISEWGHNFRPDYLKIAETTRSLNAERVLALTATATPSVVEDICAAFAIPPDAAIVTGFYRKNLTMLTTAVAATERDKTLVARLRERPAGATIVYVTLQKTAERVAHLLEQSGLSAKPYHAGLESVDREAVQEWWTELPGNIVVATIAFGMGIDKADVRYVYHYNLPKSLESYSQEIGRAGRDGEPSIVEMLACADDVPTLQNFAYGDTPTAESLRSLIAEMVSLGDEFDVSQYDLSGRHDLRPLVLRTALTYLELAGVLRQGTPFYNGYEFRALMSPGAIIGQFKGEPAELVRGLFERSKLGRTWYTLSPDAMAETLGKERKRIVRALEYMEEHRWIELRAADVRNRYTLLDPNASVDALTAELDSRFARREQQEILRLQQVLDLIQQDGCQVTALVGHFGERRDVPCGHCSYCLTGKPASLAPAHGIPTAPGRLDIAAFDALRRKHPAVFSTARQAARFLCGLSSPAIQKARLGRDPLFGALETVPFADVMAWCAV